MCRLTLLDLDKAFDGDTFVQLGGESTAGAAEGGGGGAAHARLLERENINLIEVLAGGDASSGVPQVALSHVEAQPAAVRVAAHALSDTLVRAYLAAYKGETPLAPLDTGPLHRCARLLMKLAIIVMADCEA